MRNRDVYEQDVVAGLLKILKLFGFMIIFNAGGTKPTQITYPTMKGDVMAFKNGTFFPFEVKGEGPFETQIHDDAIGKSLRYTIYHEKKTFNLYTLSENYEHETVRKIYDMTQLTEITGERIHPLIIVTKKFHKRIIKSIKHFNLPIGYLVLNYKPQKRKRQQLKFFNCGKFKKLCVSANEKLKTLSPETRRRRKYTS